MRNALVDIQKMAAEKRPEVQAMMEQKAIIKNEASPLDVDIDRERGLVLGRFVERGRPTFIEMYDRTYRPEREASDQGER